MYEHRKPKSQRRYMLSMVTTNATTADVRAQDSLVVDFSGLMEVCRQLNPTDTTQASADSYVLESGSMVTRELKGFQVRVRAIATSGKAQRVPSDLTRKFR